MTEPTLSLTLDHLRDEIASEYFGGQYSSTPGAIYDDALGVGEKAQVDDMVSSALRRFYNPALGPGRSHSWSFLKPWMYLQLNAELTGSSTVTMVYDHTGGTYERQITMTGDTWPSWFTETTAPFSSFRIAGINYTVEAYKTTTVLTLTESNNPGEDIASTDDFALNQSNYVLPDDLAYIEGDVTFRQQDNSHIPCRKVMPETIEMRRMQTAHLSMNTPRWFATRAMARTETQGTRQEMLFYPDINEAAVAFFQYQVRPNSLTNDAGYPYGASDHSETIKASCLAVVEEASSGVKGVRYQTFRELLEASVMLDARNKRVEEYGHHGPTSRRYGGGQGSQFGGWWPGSQSEMPHYSSI